MFNLGKLLAGMSPMGWVIAGHMSGDLDRDDSLLWQVHRETLGRPGVRCTGWLLCSGAGVCRHALCDVTCLGGSLYSDQALSLSQSFIR